MLEKDETILLVSVSVFTKDLLRQQSHDKKCFTHWESESPVAILLNKDPNVVQSIVLPFSIVVAAIQWDLRAFQVMF